MSSIIKHKCRQHPASSCQPATHLPPLLAALRGEPAAPWSSALATLLMPVKLPVKLLSAAAPLPWVPARSTSAPAWDPGACDSSRGVLGLLMLPLCEALLHIWLPVPGPAAAAVVVAAAAALPAAAAAAAAATWAAVSGGVEGPVLVQREYLQVGAVGRAGC
jgi:hypothetical protein